MLPAKVRNGLLLVASYYFYMNWKPVYGCLILLITLVSWGAAIYAGNGSRRKAIFAGGLTVCFGVLLLFKYAGFVSSSINEIFVTLRISMHIPVPDILLPVGISFYTFQAVGYLIDVYKGEIRPERSLIVYALFISFFPQLVAGPIERASRLLPQFRAHRTFRIADLTEGIRLMLWGYFMKVVVADRLAVYVDSVYNNAAYHNGTSLILATFFFSFQIYCDFGGYSAIAIGCAKAMGFELMNNFRRPYLATSVTDFWRRWHISLSTWFKDYLYIPLGGNRCNTGRNYINLMATFIVSGIWHGANFTFMLWGALNGAFQIAAKITAGIRSRAAANLFGKPSALGKRVGRMASIGFTFILISFAWVFFRANSIAESIIILRKIIFQPGPLFTNNIDSIIYGSLFVGILITSDILQERNYGRHVMLENRRAWLRYASYVAICLIIIAFGVFDGSQFIYFQF
jgi:D-alanyl-lipoteichoic acid acyltransferase DltB (MBOAT superfamily)